MCQSSRHIFYQRFGPTGECLNPSWPRITTWESEKAFSPREKGLRVILINPPIREWSWPNIMPIGQGSVGAVAAMDLTADSTQAGTELQETSHVSRR